MALTISYDGFGVVANSDGITDSAGGSWSEPTRLYSNN